MPATSGYDIGRKLLTLGLYGIDEEKLDGLQASDKSWAKSEPAPSAAEASAKKKKKKVSIISKINNSIKTPFFYL